MKIKDIEGTPEEIGKICIEQNFSLNEYLHDKTKISNLFFLIVSITFLILCSVLWTIKLSETLQRILFLCSLLMIAILSVALHLKFKKLTVTITAGFFGILMLSVSLNILTPKEAINTLKERYNNNLKK
jgi:chromate transport protein ChrA